MLLGAEAMVKLKKAKVAVFGLGGVGSYTVEALVRSGVGQLALFDFDRVEITNLNRQLIADRSTIGKKKTRVTAQRVLSINPHCIVEENDCFYSKENADDYDLSTYDYIVDAIDSVKSKVLLIERSKAAGIPIISCMGAGNKLDPCRFQVADIYKTSVCPLAKIMRRKLRDKGIESLKVVYSDEEPVKAAPLEGSDEKTPPATGSLAYVPSVAGLILAGEVIKDLIKD
ncbi:MAG: tRNA threonylcarbamoyladenosine dehydratase [Clostridiales bacterium]|nr:tRNA threonylcarbamoyladenosine dehydratase [Clostridiales bacterium]